MTDRNLVWKFLKAKFLLIDLIKELSLQEISVMLINLIFGEFGASSFHDYFSTSLAIDAPLTWAFKMRHILIFEDLKGKSLF